MGEPKILKYKLRDEDDWTDTFEKPEKAGCGVSSDVYKVKGKRGEELAISLLREEHPDEERQNKFLRYAGDIINEKDNAHFVRPRSCGYGQLDEGTRRAAVLMPYVGCSLWQLARTLSNNHKFSEEKKKDRTQDIIHCFAHRTFINLLQGLSQRKHRDLLPPNGVIRGIEILEGITLPLEAILTPLRTAYVQMVDYEAPEDLRTTTILAMNQSREYLGFYSGEIQETADDKYSSQDVYCAISIWAWLLSLPKNELLTNRATETPSGKKEVRSDLIALNYTDNDQFYKKHFHERDIKIVKDIVNFSRRNIYDIKPPEDVLKRTLELLRKEGKFLLPDFSDPEPTPGTKRHVILCRVDAFGSDPMVATLDLAGTPEHRQRLQAKLLEYSKDCRNDEESELKSRYNQKIGLAIEKIEKQRSSTDTKLTGLATTITNEKAKLLVPTQTKQQEEGNIDTVVQKIGQEMQNRQGAYSTLVQRRRDELEAELRNLGSEHQQNQDQLSGQIKELQELKEGKKDKLGFSPNGINVEEYNAARCTITQVVSNLTGLRKQEEDFRSNLENFQKQKNELESMKKPA